MSGLTRMVDMGSINGILARVKASNVMRITMVPFRPAPGCQYLNSLDRIAIRLFVVKDTAERIYGGRPWDVPLPPKARRSFLFDVERE